MTLIVVNRLASLARRGRHFIGRRRGDLACVLLLGVAVLLVYALPALSHFDSRRLSNEGDASAFQFYLGWNIHAILHAQSPFVTQAVYAPGGLNLATTATIPSVALLVSPITLAVGTTAAYNVALLLGVWSSAVAVLLLARELFGSKVGAFLAASLIVVSPYEVMHGIGGHLNLVWIGGLPFGAFLVARHVRGRLSRRWLIVGVALTVAFTIGAGTELFVTEAVFGAIALVVAIVVAGPDMRRRLWGSVPAQAIGAVVGLVFASPAIYAALSAGLPSSGLNKPGGFPTDLTNLFVPSGPVFAASPFTTVRDSWLANSVENTGYLPVTVLLVVLIALTFWSTSRALRGILLFAGIAVLLSFGPYLTIDGKSTIPAPGALLAVLPVVRFALPGRFSAWVFIGAALLVAWLWSSGRVRRPWTLALAALSCVLLVPDLDLVPYPTDTHLPPYVASGELVRQHGGENLLVLPPGQSGPGMVWQAETDFAFRMPTGPCCGASLPAAFSDPTAAALWSAPPAFDWKANLPSYLRRVGVSTVLVDPRDPSWLTLMDTIYPGRGQLVGGVWIFDVSSNPVQSPNRS